MALICIVPVKAKVTRNCVTNVWAKGLPFFTLFGVCKKFFSSTQAQKQSSSFIEFEYARATRVLLTAPVVGQRYVAISALKPAAVLDLASDLPPLRK